jgi:aminopeptidase N
MTRGQVSKRATPARSIALLALVLACGCDARDTGALSEQSASSGGVLSARQAAFDVVYYGLDVEVLPKRRQLAGEATVRFTAVEDLDEIELDLYPDLKTTAVVAGDAAADFVHDGGKLIVTLPEAVAAGESAEVVVSYAGRPHTAENPPWKGGFVWSTTDDGHPWLATAVQGRGCDLWWPCKDHFSDKPDAVDLRFTVPAGVSAVSNGVLVEETRTADGRGVFHWRIDNPLSPYNVALNVGPFVRVREEYESVNGVPVALEFWALPENEEKARRLLQEDARPQLAFFERLLGPYPWANEKVGFVETPHLGMEHQTINAYGNQYKVDPHGYDWLLQHELAHEWFGNLITHERANDAWLHEGFGSYMQPVYSAEVIGDMAYGHQLYEAYLRQKNCGAIVRDGEIDVEIAFEGGDIYSKGSWTLHTLRGLIGDDAFWRAVRRLLYDTAEPWSLTPPFPPRYRSTEDFARFAAEESGRDLGWFFDVYVRSAQPPELTSERTEAGLWLQWTTEDDRPFPMPIPVAVNGTQTLVAMEDGEGFVAATRDDRVRIDPGLTVLRKLPIIGSCEEQTEEGRKRQEQRRRRQAEEYGWSAG